MALTTTVTETERRLKRVHAEVEIAFDNSYPTGGEAISIAQMERIRRAFFDVASAGGYIVGLDEANQKVKVYYSNDDAGSDGPLIEVANTTDLSALTAVKGYLIGE